MEVTYRGHFVFGEETSSCHDYYTVQIMGRSPFSYSVSKSIQ